MYRFSFSGTRSIISGTLKIGQNDPKIPNLEFENHSFLENQVFLPTEQAGANICRMIRFFEQCQKNAELLILMLILILIMMFMLIVDVHILH